MTVSFRRYEKHPIGDFFFGELVDVQIGPRHCNVIRLTMRSFVRNRGDHDHVERTIKSEPGQSIWKRPGVHLRTVSSKNF